MHFRKSGFFARFRANDFLIGGFVGQPAGAARQFGPGRRLPHHARRRVRRIRHHLRGRGSQPRHHGGHQGVLPDRFRRPRRHHERAAEVGTPQADLRQGPHQLPRGGAHAGALRASLHRSRQPRVRDQLDRLHGDALRAGHEPGGLAAQPRALALAERARSPRRPAARCARDDARGQLPAPRHRPRQHHRARGRHARAARLRRGPPGGGGDEPLAHGHRQGGLFPARAVRQRRPPAGAVVRSLRLRRHALPGRHRQGAGGVDAARRRGPHAPGGRGRARGLPPRVPGCHRRLPQGEARRAAAVGGAAAADAARARVAVLRPRG